MRHEQRENRQGTKGTSTNLLGLDEVFLIKLKERLDVIGSEGNGNEKNVVVSFSQSLDRIARLGSQPRTRSDLGLPDETVRIRIAESVHDC